MNVDSRIGPAEEGFPEAEAQDGKADALRVVVRMATADALGRDLARFVRHLERSPDAPFRSEPSERLELDRICVHDPEV